MVRPALLKVFTLLLFLGYDQRERADREAPRPGALLFFSCCNRCCSALWHGADATIRGRPPDVRCGSHPTNGAERPVRSRGAA
jgi:hypothetical protein